MYELIPHFIYDKFQSNALNGEFSGIAMFIDISGFTAITEKLAFYGKEGAEKISLFINEVFTPCIDSVYKRNGFISHFSGDAFLAIFEGENFEAVNSAMEIINSFKKQRIKDSELGFFALQAKAGMSYGKIEWCIMGKGRRKAFFFRGEAVDNCSQGQKYGKSMDIIIDGCLFNLIKEKIIAEEISKKFYKLSASNIRENINKETALKTMNKEIIKVFFSEKIIDEKPLDELRDIINIYISFREDIPLNDFITDIIELSDMWGGYFNKICYDDKKGIILVNFGCPVSYEDNILRAFGFAGQIRSKYKRYFRAGITFGRVFAGFIGNYRRASYDVLGDAVNLSARIAMSAVWGDICISENIAKYIHNDFNLDYIASFLFKGKSLRTRIYRLNEKKASSLISFFGNIYGREEEIQLLKEFIDPIFQNKFAGIIYIYGDAGIGKSRLVDEIIKRLKDIAKICFLQCDGIIKRGWNPFIYYLNQHFQQNRHIERDVNEREDVFNAIFDELILKLDQSCNSNKHQIISELKRTESFIRALLSLNTKDSLFENLGPEDRFNNTMYAIKAFFKALSILKPIIIHIEDFHWIDDDSKEMISHITRNIEDYPISFICTGRFNDDGSKPGLILENSINAKEIILERLSRNAIEALIIELLGKRPDKGLLSFIQEKTNNNPFFAEQFSFFLKENNLVSLKNNTLTLIKETRDIPVKINQILIARIDRLKRELKELAKITSVIGNEFDKAIIERAISLFCDQFIVEKYIETEKFDIEAIINLRKNIMEYLREGEKENIWNNIKEMTYIFRHSLIREGAYNMQLQERLRLLHRTIALSIEKSLEYVNDDYLLDIAYHYEKANIINKAIDYLERAGNYLKSSFKNHKAIEIYYKLLSFITDSEKGIRIKMKIGEIYLLLGNLKESEIISLECIDSACRIKNDHLLAECYNFIGILSNNKADYKNAIEYCKKSILLYEKLNDQDGILMAYGNQGEAYSHLGNFKEAMKCLKTTMDIARKLGYENEYYKSLGNMGIIYSDLGQYEKALKYLSQYEKISERKGDKKSIGNATASLGSTYFYLGQYEKALNYFYRSIKYREETGEKASLSGIIGNIGAIYRRQGKTEKAIKYLKMSKHIAKEIGYKPQIAISDLNIGNIHYDNGEYDKALEFFSLYKDYTKETGDMPGYALALSNIGIVYMDLGSFDKALELFEKQKKISQENKDLLSEARADSNIAETYHKQGKYKSASKYYEKAIKTYNNLGIKDFYLIQCLEEKANILYSLDDLPGAIKLNNEAFVLANDIGDMNCIIDTSIQKHVLNAKSDKESAINGLLGLLSKDITKDQKAKISYEISKIREY